MSTRALIATPTQWACQTDQRSGCEELCYFGYLCSDPEPSGARKLTRVEQGVSLCSPEWLLRLPWSQVRRTATRTRKGNFKGCYTTFLK